MREDTWENFKEKFDIYALREEELNFECRKRGIYYEHLNIEQKRAVIIEESKENEERTRQFERQWTRGDLEREYAECQRLVIQFKGQVKQGNNKNLEGSLESLMFHLLQRLNYHQTHDATQEWEILIMEMEDVWNRSGSIYGDDDSLKEATTTSYRGRSVVLEDEDCKRKSRNDGSLGTIPKNGAREADYLNDMGASACEPKDSDKLDTVPRVSVTTTKNDLGSRVEANKSEINRNRFEHVENTAKNCRYSKEVPLESTPRHEGEGTSLYFTPRSDELNQVKLKDPFKTRSRNNSMYLTPNEYTWQLRQQRNVDFVEKPQINQHMEGSLQSQRTNERKVFDKRRTLSATEDDLRSQIERLEAELRSLNHANSMNFLNRPAATERAQIIDDEGPRYAGTPTDLNWYRRLEGRSGLPIAKWAIEKFDGKPETWTRFLAKIRRFSEAEGITEGELLQGSIHLFKGDALDWILNNRPKSWNILVEEMSQFVHGTKSDLERLREISKQKQGRENCSTFIQRLLLQFQDLRIELTEEEKIDYILRGLKPELGASLAANILLTSVKDVEKAATRMERIIGKSSQIRMVDALETEDKEVAAFAGKANNPSKNQSKWSPRPQRRSEVDEKPKKKIFCYKCGEPSHIAIGCRNPPALFCRKCGYKDRDEKDCPDCNKPSEN